MKIGLFKKADLIIIAFCIIAGIAAFIFFSSSGGEGRQAVIEYRGETVRVIDLDSVAEEYTFTVRGDLDVEITVSPEGVRFSASACPDKLCVAFGTLSKRGQIAVCMPAGVSVRVRGGEGCDGVTG